MIYQTVFRVLYAGYKLHWCDTILLGIDIRTPEGNTTAHAILLQCSADLPARAPLTNMKQYNGCWGCLYCDNKGTTHGEDHLHRFWPHDPSSSLRSAQSIVDDACEAVCTGEAVSCIHFEHAYLIFPYLYMFMHFRSEGLRDQQF